MNNLWVGAPSTRSHDAEFTDGLSQFCEPLRSIAACENQRGVAHRSSALYALTHSALAGLATWSFQTLTAFSIDLWTMAVLFTHCPTRGTINPGIERTIP